MSDTTPFPGSNMDDEIEKLLRDESIRLSRQHQTEEARSNIEEARKALASPERKMEYDLLAEMSWMIKSAYKKVGFSEVEAVRFSLMVTHHTMENGLDASSEDKGMAEES